MSQAMHHRGSATPPTILDEIRSLLCQVAVKVALPNSGKEAVSNLLDKVHVAKQLCLKRAVLQ